MLPKARCNASFWVDRFRWKSRCTNTLGDGGFLGDEAATRRVMPGTLEWPLANGDVFTILLILTRSLRNTIRLRRMELLRSFHARACGKAERISVKVSEKAW